MEAKRIGAPERPYVQGEGEIAGKIQIDRHTGVEVLTLRAPDATTGEMREVAVSVPALIELLNQLVSLPTEGSA